MKIEDAQAMRAFRAGAVVAAAFLLAGAAEAPPPQPADTMTDAQAAAAVMDYYPAAARKAGVAGVATLSCMRSVHYALTACTVASENPKGFGFGEAALAMAKRSRDNPAITFTPSKLPQVVGFAFSLDPPAVEPNPIATTHRYPKMQFLRAPEYQDYRNVWPERALDEGVNGKVLLLCHVAPSGFLQPCRTVWESPEGYGFAYAAQKLSKAFRVSPLIREDGVPDPAGVIQLPIQFTSVGS